MSELKKLFGRRIQEIRKLNNMKQETLAEKIGIAPRNLSNIETGRCFPSPDSLERLAEALNCKIKDLFDFEHNQDSADLFKEIDKRLKNINRNKLQDYYKILKALTDI